MVSTSRENQKHILIAEDSATQAVKLEILLESAGYRITSAADGRAALEAAQADPPDLIVSDVVMPHLSGYEFCGRAKKDERLKDVPFILLTNLNEATDIIQGLKVGTDYYVTKPYDNQFLLNKIAAVFDQPPGGASPDFMVRVDGRDHHITSTRQQIFNLLLSTYENALIQNIELNRIKEQLDKSNRELSQNFHELELSEARFSSLVQTIPDIVYRLNEEGSFVFINKAIERLGYRSEEILGVHFSQIIFPPEVDLVSREKVLPRFVGRATGAEEAPKLFDERRSGDRKTSGLEVRLLAKDESKLSPAQVDPLGDQGLFVEVNSAGLHGPSISGDRSRFLGTVGVIRDITNRKKLERELEKAYRQSEHRVIERTAELRQANEQLQKEMMERIKAEEEARRIQEQLFQSQKLEAIGTLAGGIAHDFNNMLAAILGYAELAIEDTPKDSPATDSLENITSAAMRARDLVQQILSFSRQTEREPVPLELPPLLDETLKMLRASLPATVEIDHHFIKPDKRVLADPVQIHQVMMNLCTNAAQAMENKGGVLTIKLEQQNLPEGLFTDFGHLPPGEYLVLTVGDTGVGIDGVALKKIFEPFYTTKEVGKGTGMGLSVVHGIVTDLNGLITVASGLNQGTTFAIYLPVVDPPAEIESPNRQEISPEGRERVLLIDDEPDLVDIGRMSLTRLGYKVTGVTSSVQALQVFRSAPDDFDVVITDYTMPKLTGTDLAQAILEIKPEMPIILCTGFSDQMSPVKAREFGIAKFLMKPLLPLEVGRVIRRVLAAETKEADL